jgi:hypothetical protein
MALLCFFLTLFASLFKSKSRLEAENAALRHQLIVLQRRVSGRVQLANGDRLFLVMHSPRSSDASHSAMSFMQGLAAWLGAPGTLARVKRGLVWLGYRVSGENRPEIMHHGLRQLYQVRR